MSIKFSAVYACFNKRMRVSELFDYKKMSFASLIVYLNYFSYAQVTYFYNILLVLSIFFLLVFIIAQDKLYN